MKYPTPTALSAYKDAEALANSAKQLALKAAYDANAAHLNDASPTVRAAKAAAHIDADATAKAAAKAAKSAYAAYAASEAP